MPRRIHLEIRKPTNQRVPMYNILLISAVKELLARLPRLMRVINPSRSIGKIIWSLREAKIGQDGEKQDGNQSKVIHALNIRNSLFK